MDYSNKLLEIQSQLHSRDTEIEVLRHMIDRRESAAVIFREINEKDFLERDLKLIFITALDLDSNDPEAITQKILATEPEFKTDILADAIYTPRTDLINVINILKEYSTKRTAFIKLQNIFVELPDTSLDDFNKRLGEVLKESAQATIEKDIPLDQFLKQKREKDSKRKPGPLGYGLNEFKQLCDNIDGVQPGFYVIGAATNYGKTALLVNLFLDLIKSNQDLKGLYISLDDSRNIIVNRFLAALSELSINEVQRNNNFESVNNAYSDLLTYARAGKLQIKDSSTITDLNKIEIELLRNSGDMFLMIDDLHNLDTGGKYQSQRELNIERANAIKELSVKFNIPIICTAELRKRPAQGGQDKPPILDDVMETGKFTYNADCVLFLYPADLQAYDNRDDPDLILKFAKNKLYSFRGQQELRFVRGKSLFAEIQEKRG